MSEKDLGNLLSILNSCSKIQNIVADFKSVEKFYEDEKTFDAVLIMIIEKLCQKYQTS